MTLHILIAPSGFKESLDADAVAKGIAAGCAGPTPRPPSRWRRW